MTLQLPERDYLACPLRVAGDLINADCLAFSFAQICGHPKARGEALPSINSRVNTVNKSYHASAGEAPIRTTL
jgi:hypothetical protein